MLEVLTMHVLGPGYGESILLHFPSDEWVVIDSFQIGKDIGPLQVLKSAAATKVSGIILSHPHEDHAAGLHSIIDSYRDVAWVGCLTSWVDSDQWDDNADAEKDFRISARRHTLSAIQEIWRNCPSKKWKMIAGSHKKIGEARLTVLFPDKKTLNARTPNGRPPKDQNALSTPLLLKWKNVRLLLGADLPAQDWVYLDKNRLGKDVHLHASYKVAHHASKDAHSERVVGNKGPTTRIWIATPWNRGRKLPRFEDEEGVHKILKCVDNLYLTALPLKHSGGFPDEVTRQSIRDNVIPTHGVKIADGLVLQPLPSPKEKIDGVIRITFHPDGEVEEIWRGAHSLVVKEAKK